MPSAGDEDEDESGEERLPSCFDYVMHFLTVFWKVLFACVPPTEYCHGWACFVVSILIIGMLTAIIGEQGETGTITLTAKAKGLRPARCTVKVE